MKIHNIVIFIPSGERRDFPYSGERSAARHSDLISYFPKNVQFYLAIHREQYIENDFFLPQFIRVGDTWRKYNGEQVYSHFILGHNQGLDSKNIYHNPIRNFCKDKTQIETIFPTHTFQSQTCHSYSDIVAASKLISTKTKVYKPNYGSAGVGIIISNTLPKEYELEGEYPYLVQDFFDTSGGFDGHVGIHDFRVIILNGKVTGSFLRIAPDGIMTANVSTGASIIDYHGTVPKQIQATIKQVENYTSKLYPDRYYSIDVGVGNKGEVKIFELNSNPMLSTPSIIQGLAEHIIKNILKLS